MDLPLFSLCVNPLLVDRQPLNRSCKSRKMYQPLEKVLTRILPLTADAKLSHKTHHAFANSGGGAPLSSLSTVSYSSHITPAPSLSPPLPPSLPQIAGREATADLATSHSRSAPPLSLAA